MIRDGYCLVLRVQALNPLRIKCGDDGLKDTPVPMPNTEVKLQRAESSWGIAPCEDRALPCKLKTSRSDDRDVFLSYRLLRAFVKLY